jgi:hypothetical protein
MKYVRILKFIKLFDNIILFQIAIIKGITFVIFYILKKFNQYIIN